MHRNIVVKLQNTMNSLISQTGLHVGTSDPLAPKLALEYLKVGSVIAVPTDTVYGLACDATNTLALKKLYEIKERCAKKPLAICLGDLNEIKTWANIQHLPQNLLSSLLPGPFTIILRCVNERLDKSLILDGKVGIRVPDYKFICNLSQDLRKPLALTSANLSNEPSAVEVYGFQSIWNRVSVIFDGGKLNCDIDGNASTIVDLSDVGYFNIVRQGAAYNRIIEILKNFDLKNKY